MKNIYRILIFACLSLLILLVQCTPPEETKTDYTRVSQVETGIPRAVMLSVYSTTLVADGKDRTRMRIAVTDSTGKEITSARDSIRLYVNGEATVLDEAEHAMAFKTDTAGKVYVPCQLDGGLCWMVLQAGDSVGRIRVEAVSGNLWPGGHEIHTLPATFKRMEPTPEMRSPTTLDMDRMVGADISFLPQLESRGRTFYDGDTEKDAICLLRDHGMNYIRLRIFVNPENEKGYSPGEGYCGLKHTLEMASRVKEAGMKLLLNFHYSDYWADPQQQNKPASWEGLSLAVLSDSLYAYTVSVLRAFEQQGTPPDMVQVGNEINHGILWPEGHISHPDQLATLLKAGVKGVREVDPAIPVMMHIALGGQNDEAVFWLNNMIARGVRFDLIGISYYPRWHGTLDDLNQNLHDLVERYHKPVNVVEYSLFIPEVHEIVFGLPGGMGQGTCNWEPLGWRSRLFDRDGHTTPQIFVYDTIRDRYLNAEAVPLK
jgi:arabinogalactan endo-1,4-beta-galactosidase